MLQILLTGEISRSWRTRRTNNEIVSCSEERTSSLPTESSWGRRSCVPRNFIRNVHPEVLRCGSFLYLILLKQGSFRLESCSSAVWELGCGHRIGLPLKTARIIKR